MEPAEIRGVLVPREGFLRKKEMEALFNVEIQTVMRWIKKGIIPAPLNYSEQFSGLLGSGFPKMWDAEAVWTAFDKLRGVTKTHVPNEADVAQ